MNKPNLNNPEVRKEPFRVPEGYFEGFAEQMMQKLPEAAEPQEAEAAEADRAVKVPFWKTDLYAKVKPYIYMAAMMSGLYFGIWVYKYQQRVIGEKSQAAAMQSDGQQRAADEMTTEEMDNYINDACDYMMTDGHDIMACVTGAE